MYRSNWLVWTIKAMAEEELDLQMALSASMNSGEKAALVCVFFIGKGSNLLWYLSGKGSNNGNKSFWSN